MQTALRKDALTEVYIDVEDLIYSTVWNFKARYGGDFDELKAEANLIYVLVFDSHNESKGAFSTWLYFCIWKGLLDFLNEVRKKDRCGVVFHNLNKAKNSVKIPTTFHLFEVLEEVGQDAKTIIKLTLYPPEGITEEDLKRGCSACKTRIRLKVWLRYRLGWSQKRIRETFREIRRVLCDEAI